VLLPLARGLARHSRESSRNDRFHLGPSSWCACRPYRDSVPFFLGLTPDLRPGLICAAPSGLGLREARSRSLNYDSPDAEVKNLQCRRRGFPPFGRLRAGPFAKTAKDGAPSFNLASASCIGPSSGKERPPQDDRGGVVAGVVMRRRCVPISLGAGQPGAAVSTFHASVAGGREVKIPILSRKNRETRMGQPGPCLAHANSGFLASLGMTS
jgi:hypothetical protein